MSREKDNENGDRHGLVEEGAICQPDKSTKDTKESVEAKWIHEAFAKQSAPKYPVRPVPQTSLPEVRPINVIPTHTVIKLLLLKITFLTLQVFGNART